MDIAGSIVVLLVGWWIAFQAMLPVGVKNHAEAGAADSKPIGDPGAPMRPDLLRKALWSGVIALAIWAALFTLINWSGLKFSDLPSP